MKTKVIIDPASGIWYSSFYIIGLYKVFGKKNVTFSRKYFRELKRKKETHLYDQYMAFVVVSPNKSLNKIIVDFGDKPTVNESAYEWCDKYAKINFNIKLTDKSFHDKMVSIPPGFGIQIWNFWETVYYCCSNFIKCKFSPKIKLFYRDYHSQCKRPILENYIGKLVDEGVENPDIPFVFMIATLWTHKNCIEGTNLLRKTFVEVCKTLNCSFEGGFIASESHPQYSEFQDLIFSVPYSMGRYIKKTKQSSIVFNTPAVHNCHGWKLGEYLAMGKAIISTPISNQLPEALEHGKNIHIVQNNEELKTAINLLLKDSNYREKLENGAKDYYSKLAKPDKVIAYILG